MSELDKAVAVAVDGSAYAQTAADWAAGEALRRGAPLRVVTVVEATGGTGLLAPGTVRPDWDHRAEETLDLLADTEARLGKAHPDLVVTHDALVGDPMHELDEVSRKAAVLVVGSRGRGGFAGLAVGSVSLHLAAHAHCPLIVVPQGHAAAAHPGPTVVGLDAHADVHVLRYALGHAQRAGGGLRVLHAWNPYPAHSASFVSDTDITARHAQERLAERIKAVHAHHHQFRPEVAVLRGRAAEVLVEQSRDADLIVVGSRHRWLTLPGAVGPVLHELLLHARCPVAVVPVR